MSKSSLGWVKVLYVLLAILYIITGLYALFNPVAFELTLGLFIGCMMIAYGVMMVIAYFMAAHFKSVWTLILGILLVVLGFVVASNLFESMNVIGIIAGIAFICSGAFKIYQSFQVKDLGIKSWWLVLILGICTLIVGGIMAFDPAASGAYFAIWVGCSFLVDGIDDLILAFSLM